MSEFVYQRDTWFAPLQLDATNNVVVFTDTAGTQTITLDLVDSGTGDPLDYLNAVGAGFEGSRQMYIGGDYVPLLDRLVAAINTASSNTYEFQTFTPTGYQAAIGVKLVQTAGSGGFSWDFSSGSWTLNPRILGFASTIASDVSSIGGEIESQYSTYGVWVSHTITDGEATRKLRRRTKNISLSSDDVKYASRKQYHARDYRQFVYEYVPGAHIRENRAEDADSAATASLAENDINQAFYDVWDLGTQKAIAAGRADFDLEVGQLVPLEVRHNVVDVLGGAASSNTAEVLKFSEESQITDFDAMLNVMRVAGEYYRLTVDTLTIGTLYEQ